MTQNNQRSSTRNTTHNDPRDGAQSGARDERGSTASELQISAERKSYLAETYGYSTQQVDVMRNVICTSATDAELEFFLATCKRVKLDPFARQIYFIKRPQRVEDAHGNTNWIPVGKPEVSIDGLRAGAEMTGEYEGQGAMQWCGKDGKWRDVWLEDAPPVAAKATIFRKGQREALVNVALYREFCPVYRNGKSPEMWLKMAANQLAKCAEAGALRRAFPRDLSGLYTDTEMEHVAVSAQSYTAPTAAAATAKVIDVVEQPALAAGESGPIAQLTDADKTDLAEMLKQIKDAKDRNALAPVGARITAAKKKKEENRSPVEHEIMSTIETALTAKWRELPPPGAKPA